MSSSYRRKLAIFAEVFSTADRHIVYCDCTSSQDFPFEKETADETRCRTFQSVELRCLRQQTSASIATFAAVLAYKRKDLEFSHWLPNSALQLENLYKLVSKDPLNRQLDQIFFPRTKLWHCTISNLKKATRIPTHRDTFECRFEIVEIYNLESRTEP